MLASKKQDYCGVGLTKRIIPCLDVRDGRTVKGVNFQNLRDAGDPVELARWYSHQGADELVLLDVSATLEGRSTFVDVVKRVAREVNIPFTVGGGISSVDIARTLIRQGADKVSVNSAAVRRPELVSELAAEFGSQAVVVAIDAAQQGSEWLLYTHSASQGTGRKVLEWAAEVCDRGAGEILLTSIDHDGTKQGFALELTNLVSSALRVPVIASGGAGSIQHFLEVFTSGNADAAIAASVFHFQEILISDLKNSLKQAGVEVRYGTKF